MPKQRQNTSKGPIVSGKTPARKPWYRRPVMLITIAVLVVVIGVAGWSIYNFQIRPYNQTVLKLNGTAFDMRYFLNSLKAYYTHAGSDTGIADYADYVEQQIEHNQIVIQGSAALGVEIPRDTVVSELSLAKLPLDQEYVDMLMASDLISKQVPTSQPQYNVQAMLLESEAQAQVALARLQAGDNFTAVASDLTTFPSGEVDPIALGWVTPRQADIAVSSTKFGDSLSSVNAGSLSSPVYDDTVTKKFGYWIVKLVDKKLASDNVTPSEVNLQGILVASEQEANDVAAKLNAGADWDELAKQVSQITGAADNGAQLGWITLFQDPYLFKASFNLPLNTVSGPITDTMTLTKGGYWIFSVLEKDDNRALTSNQQSTLENDLIERCTAALKKNPDYKVENLLTQEMKDFALDEVVLTQGAGSVLIGINSLPTGEVGVPYNCQIKIYGAKNGNTWSITEGRVPEGLTFDTAKGILSGTPTVAGGGGITFRVGNDYHYHALSLNFIIRMAISVTTDALPDGKVGETYSQMLEAFSDAATLDWSKIDGEFPEGLALDAASGVITGTPKAAGTFNFTVQVDDGVGKAPKALTLIIQ